MAEEVEGLEEATSQGYIKKIELENFMCHRKFEVDLTDGLNIIVGRNGSGKSSILTALIASLGGRASSTSRGDSLSQLVKTGASAAFITIHFANAPSNATLMAKYGPEFSIVRRIAGKRPDGKVSGSSGYQIKNFEGKEVSRRAKEVQEIIIQFGIFPDNPLAMLTQEQAKEFLITASASVKYKRLKAALHQQDLARYQQEMERTLHEQHKTIEILQTQRSHVERQIKNSEKVLQRAAEAASRQDRQQKLKALLKWREFKKRNDIRNRYEEETRHLQSRKRKLEESLEDQVTSEATGEQQRRIDAETLAAEESIQKNSDQLSEAQQNAERASRRVARVKAEIEDAKVAQSTSLKSFRELEDLGASETPEGIQARREELETELQQLESKKRNLYSEIEILQQKLESTIQSQDQLKKDFRNAEARVESAQRSVRDVESRMRQIENHQAAQSGLPSGFPREFTQLGKLINQTRWSAGKPVGPLGDYIDIRREFSSYLPMVMSVYARNLASYWVQSNADHKTLSNLMRRAGVRNARIIVKDNDPYGYHQVISLKNSNYSRMLEDVLSFRSDDVARLLIDSAKAEGHVIAVDDGQHSGSSTVCDSVLNDRQLRVKTVYVGSRQKHTGGMSFGAYSKAANSVLYTPIAAFKGGPRVHVESGVEVKQYQDYLEEHMAELREAKELVAKLQPELSRSNSNRSRQESSLQKHQRESNQVEMEIRAVRRAISELPDPNALQTIASGIESQIVEARHRLEAANGAIEQATSALQFSLDQEKAARSAVSDCDRELALAKRRLDRCATESAHLISKQRKSAALRNDLIAKIMVVGDEIENVEAKERGAFSVMDQVRKDAEILGPNPTVNPEAYQTSDLNSNGDELRQNLRDLEAVQEKSAVKEEDLGTAEKEIASLQDSLKTIEQTIIACRSLAERTEKSHERRQIDSDNMWNVAKSVIVRKFASLLAQRKFTGVITIDDNKHTLETVATPESSESRGAATLSGGERSFSQIALLISVWESMRAGLVAVDEYDVFMDKANRALSLNLLTESVRSHKMQCILITPQDIDLQAVDETYRESIKLHKLNPPVR